MITFKIVWAGGLSLTMVTCLASFLPVAAAPDREVRSLRTEQLAQVAGPHALLRANLIPPSPVEGLELPCTAEPVVFQTPIKRVGGPRLKTSLNAYSFNKLLNDQIKGRGKGMSLLELLDFCAEDNFDAIDPTGYFFPGYPKPPSEQYINEFKRRAFVLGLDISGTGVRNSFAQADEDKRAADVQHVKEWIDVAARLGAPVLRVFAGPMPEGHSWDEVAGWMVKDLKKCVAYGKQRGVIIGVQNHGDSLKTADQVLKVVKMVDEPEWFGVIVDTGYFLEDPYKEIAAVAPYAVNWQVKEHLGGKAGTVKTDLKRIVRIAREAGYRGYLPIETLEIPGKTTDTRARVRELHRALREELRQAE
jgi:sugar phosphate isomerase/epimerase